MFSFSMISFVNFILVVCELHEFLFLLLIYFVKMVNSNDNDQIVSNLNELYI